MGEVATVQGWCGIILHNQRFVWETYPNTCTCVNGLDLYPVTTKEFLFSNNKEGYFGNCKCKVYIFFCYDCTTLNQMFYFEVRETLQFNSACRALPGMTILNIFKQNLLATIHTAIHRKLENKMFSEHIQSIVLSYIFIYFPEQYKMIQNKVAFNK